MTCTATHTVTQADIDAGHYVNTACVDDGAGGAAQACADVDDVPGTQNPHLTITKVATEASYSAVGDVIHYTIVATNDGNIDAGGGDGDRSERRGSDLHAGQRFIAGAGRVDELHGHPHDHAGRHRRRPLLSTRRVSMTVPAGAAQACAQRRRSRSAAGEGPHHAHRRDVQRLRLEQSERRARRRRLQRQGEQGQPGQPGRDVLLHQHHGTLGELHDQRDAVERQGWKPIPAQAINQIILYESNCSKSSKGTASYNTATGTATITVTGATAGATYIVGVKYSLSGLGGQPVSSPFPTVTYSFATNFNGGSPIASSGGHHRPLPEALREKRKSDRHRWEARRRASHRHLAPTEPNVRDLRKIQLVEEQARP